MTIINNLIMTPHADADIKEFFALAQKGIEGVSAVPGVEDVVFTAVTIGGPATNAFSLMTSCADWEAFGKIQQHINTSPEFVQLLIDASKLASWETYVGQTVDFDLLPS